MLIGTAAATATLLLSVACAPPRQPSQITGGSAVSAAAPAAKAQSAGAPAANVAKTATDLKLAVTEWKFDQPKLSVPAGPLTLTLENKGLIEHDVLIEALGVHLHAMPGKTETKTFTLGKPGTYDFVCSLPGHKEAGMKGSIVVGEANGVAQTHGVAQDNRKPAPAAAPAAAVSVAKPLPNDVTRLPQPVIAPPVTWTSPRTHKMEIESTEVTALVDEGVATTVWTFGGSVPGPMLRVRQGDTVELTFRNAVDSKLTHSIDLHAVTGPGGGGRATQVPPGGSATFTFQALNPGVYVCHCATPMVAHHIASGMYGLIVVEPQAGLPKVDREFYVMQGDMYLQGARGEQGLRDASIDKLLDETPDYVLFNGGVGAVSKDNALKAKVGETVRIFFGVGGPNLTSSFHVIGEIFDRVYPEGSSEPLTNVQTTLVPAGGATIVDFKLDVPGTYILVDHSLGRLEKGAAAILEVEGPESPKVFTVNTAGAGGTGGH